MKNLSNENLTFLALTAIVLILSGYSCNNNKNNSSVKKVQNSLSQEKQNYSDSEEKDDADFLNDLSAQRSSDIELEIKKLVAMLEKEESLIEKKLPDNKYQTILFKQSSENLSNEQNQEINQIAKKVAKAVKSGKTVELRGHCDIFETDEENAFALAEKRALMVKDELIKQNIPAEKIKISSIGAREPVVFGFNSENQELENLANRRVEVWTL